MIYRSSEIVAISYADWETSIPNTLEECFMMGGVMKFVIMKLIWNES